MLAFSSLKVLSVVCVCCLQGCVVDEVNLVLEAASVMVSEVWGVIMYKYGGSMFGICAT
jgi:hypothetical protein